VHDVTGYRQPAVAVSLPGGPPAAKAPGR